MTFSAQDILAQVITTVGPLILAIGVHEWAHVAMARFLGDPTGEQRGRLTLNPLAHVDPLWTVGLPIYFVVTSALAGGSAMPFFGAGKPAPYNPTKLTRTFGGKRISMSLGELLVAAAGPLSNLALALLITLVLVVLVRGGHPLDVDVPNSPSLLAFKFIAMNVSLFVFNLVPVPPLDGSKILFNALPRAVAAQAMAVTERLSWVLLILLFVGGSVVLAPIQRVIVGGLLYVVAALT
ncbi:MAG: site-2 protease family protein [Deltaproteobacteria bacterium]|nr:site-2 protease family protein [Deltaproteobacteria bacterium]